MKIFFTVLDKRMYIKQRNCDSLIFLINNKSQLYSCSDAEVKVKLEMLRMEVGKSWEDIPVDL
jgi:hypothetical protein